MFKNIVSNTGAQLIAKAVSAGLTFLTTILIMRQAGSSLFGDLTKALSLIAIGFTAIDFGLNAEAVRSMRGAMSSQRRTLSRVVSARFILSVLVFVAMNGIVYILPGSGADGNGYSDEFKHIFWVGSLAIIFQGLYTSLNAWFQRRLSYWKSSVSTVIGSVVTAIGTYVVLTYSPTLGNLLSVVTLGYGIMTIVSWVFVGYPVRIEANLSSTIKVLRSSLVLGMILILSVVASKIDTVILGVFRPSAEVGQYGFAYRIFEVILVLPVFVMNAVYPLLIDLTHNARENLIRRSSLGLLIVSLIGVLCVLMAAPYLELIRPGMEQAVVVLRILSLGLPLFYLTAPLMWQLIGAGHEKQVLYVYVAAAAFNGIANRLFVPSFGVPISAVLTGLTEAAILLGLVYIKRKVYGKV